MAFLEDYFVIIITIVAVLAALMAFGYYKYKKVPLQDYDQEVELTAVKEEVLKMVPFPVVFPFASTDLTRLPMSGSCFGGGLGAGSFGLATAGGGGFGSGGCGGGVDGG